MKQGVKRLTGRPKSGSPKGSRMIMNLQVSRVIGCYLGGAVGDALGAPHEFTKSWAAPESLPKQYRGVWTDDTQLSRACLRALGEPGNVIDNTRRAIVNWGTHPDGGDHRAPGNACLTAAKGLQTPGWVPDAQAWGSGAVMRSHVYGMVLDESRASHLARDCGALTHGPRAALVAGQFATYISKLIRGRVQPHRHVKWGRALLNGLDEDPVLGWTSHSAWALAEEIFLHFRGTWAAVEIAARIPGDSDTVGSMVGAMVGAYSGYEEIPARYLRKLEAREQLEAEACRAVDMARDGSKWKGDFYEQRA